MSEPEKEGLKSFLFDRTDVEVMDVKFLRGRDANLTEEELCATSKRVLAKFFSTPKPSKLPQGRRPQRSVAEIFTSR